MEFPAGTWQIATVDAIDGSTIRLRCPGCGSLGVLESIGVAKDVRRTGSRPYLGFGLRRCPTPVCRTFVAVIYELTETGEGELLVSWPAQRIDFNRINLPGEVLSSFTEAIDCHAAGCWRASLVMVRRTLEAFCEDQETRDGHGWKDNKVPDLHVRIERVQAKISIPAALAEALMELKHLGNDATHVQLRRYAQVSQNEAELAIETTKEILKAAYQHDELLSRFEQAKAVTPPKA
jgi:Domain of unknown function (DUF4145)